MKKLLLRSDSGGKKWTLGMIAKTHPDLKIRVSLMVEILRVKITLGTLCTLMQAVKEKFVNLP